MKRDQTKEKQPERSRTRAGPTYVGHVLSVERVYWLKKITIKDNMSQW